MSNPLTFLLPLRYDTVRTVLLVQSGPIDLAIEVARRVRTLFPGCTVEGLIRETDHGTVAAADFDRVVVARWEDRRDVVRRLRRERYDVVAMLVSVRGTHTLRMLPYLLRTRAILAFNDNLDYFPLHLTRLPALAHHLSGRDSAGALVRWTVGRAVVMPVATVLLLAAVARIHARAAWRRRLG